MRRRACLYAAAAVALAWPLPALTDGKPYDPSLSVYPPAATYRPPKAWGLTALLARKTKVSDARKDSKGIYQTERTIFAGPVLGAEIWKLTHDNLHNTHWYQDMSPWNADGSKIMFRAGRGGALLMDADGTGARRHVTELPLDTGRPAWSRIDPEVHYSLRKGVLYEHNVRTGKSRQLAKTGGKSIYQDPSRDGRYVICFGGASSLYDFKTGKTVAFDVLRNARDPRLKGNRCKLDEAQLVGDAEHPVRYDEDGPKNSGWFCVGADGVTAIHAFWKRKEEYYMKFRRGRHPGHPSWNPDGTKMIFFDRAGWKGIFLISKDGSWEKRLVNNGGNGHTTWLHWSDEYAFAEISGGRYFARMIVKIYTTDAQRGTVHRLAFFNSKGGYWDSPRLASSPDGTKVFWTSNAMGTRDVYFAVARHPDPPTEVKVAAGRVTWTPPDQHREIEGYLVHAGKDSGGLYTLLTSEPVAGTEFAIPPGAGPCFVVSSIEHSGLESRAYSNEAHARKVDALRLYFQAESGNPRAPLRLDNDYSAAGDLCVWASPGPPAPFEMPIDVPAAGTFTLWARTRGAKGQSFTIARLAAPAESRRWTWVKAGSLRLPAGKGKLTVSAGGGGAARLDAICLTNDPTFTPAGRCNLDRLPPGRVAGLTATPAGATVKLAWTASADPNISHYDIHFGDRAGFVPSNATLLFSPKANRFTDWGVPAGTHYYRIIAVDRAGNRSQPSEPVKVSTG